MIIYILPNIISELYFIFTIKIKKFILLYCNIKYFSINTSFRNVY